MTGAYACGSEEDLDNLAGTEDELSIVVTPAPPATPIQPIPIGRPDLIVNSFTVTGPPVLHCGTQTLSFTALESNIGTGRAGQHYLHLQRQNPLNGTWQPTSAIQLPGLGVGATRSLTGGFTFWNGPCDCLPATYTINFRLFDDGGNLIAELNEGNNASNAVTVNAACP